MNFADLSRSELRDLMHVERTREDGTRYTQVDSERRRKRNRDRNSAAKVMRKAARKKSR